LPFEKEVLAFEKGVLVFEKGVLAFENQLGYGFQPLGLEKVIWCQSKYAYSKRSVYHADFLRELSHPVELMLFFINII
jgi:hypothetical protein